MCDLCDGAGFSGHPLFGIYTCALQIILYYDDVEICNPLGSKRSKHKLGTIPLSSLSGLYLTIMYCYNPQRFYLYVGLLYFTLGNLLPQNRSSLQHIYLVGVVKKRILKTYGMNEILKPIVKDLKALVCYNYCVLLCICSLQETFHL